MRQVERCVRRRELHGPVSCLDGRYPGDDRAVDQERRAAPAVEDQITYVRKRVVDEIIDDRAGRTTGRTNRRIRASVQGNLGNTGERRRRIPVRRRVIVNLGISGTLADHRCRNKAAERNRRPNIAEIIEDQLRETGECR
jgi:hypothetical protein